MSVSNCKNEVCALLGEHIPNKKYGNFVLFNDQNIKKGEKSLKVRKHLNLKYCELDLSGGNGYHVSCYRSFNALKKKYSDDFEKTFTSVTNASLEVLENVQSEKQNPVATISDDILNIEANSTVTTELLIQDSNIKQQVPKACK